MLYGQLIGHASPLLLAMTDHYKVKLPRPLIVLDPMDIIDSLNVGGEGCEGGKG